MAQAQIMWDARGVVKWYYEEAGRATINAIFAAVASRDMFVTALGYAETYSILLRKHNGGILDVRAFVTAISALRVEVLDDRGFGLQSISDSLFFGSLSRMQAHNIYSVDASTRRTPPFWQLICATRGRHQNRAC